MPTNEPPSSSPATDRRHGYAARMDRRAGCPFGGDEPCGGCHGDCWTDAEQEREPEPLEQQQPVHPVALGVPLDERCCRGGRLGPMCVTSAGCW